MKNPKDIYQGIKRKVGSEIASMLTLLAIQSASTDVNLESIAVDEKFRPVRLPDDPNDPSYQRQYEIDRFHGLRDMERQMDYMSH